MSTGSLYSPLSNHDRKDFGHSQILQIIRSSNIFRPRNILNLFLFIVYTFVVILICNYHSLDGVISSNFEKKFTYRSIHAFNTGCNAYPMDHRIQEQKRILQSVRKELIDSSEKLKEINEVIDELNKQIPEKQLELSSIADEIDTAERALVELRDRQNVQVFLPHRPLYPSRSAIAKSDYGIRLAATLEEVIDLSRCSITSAMPIYLEKVDNSSVSNSFENELRMHGTVVDSLDLACLVISIVNGSAPKDTYVNHVILNIGVPIAAKKNQIVIQSSKTKRYLDEAVHLNIPGYDISEWRQMPKVLPYHRKYLFTLLLSEESSFDLTSLNRDITHLQGSDANETINIVRCQDKTSSGICDNDTFRENAFKSSMFCVFVPSENFQLHIWESLRSGCIPVILSLDQPLPFEKLIDWALASDRISPSRLPELHFILKATNMADTLELRRNGRRLFENYLANTKVFTSTLIAAFADRLAIPLREQKSFKAIPLFNGSFIAPILIPVNRQTLDDKYLGPLEAPVDSARYQYNFTLSTLYIRESWNKYGRIPSTPEFLTNAVEPPTETEFYSDSNTGFRPIEPGSGAEFSRALGGNRQREQFTVILLTYKRDDALMGSLERLHRLPYLNKIVVVWNNIGRDPVGAWPRIHVPVEFIRVEKNSLNNRFVPWDRIKTEAVLSLDDDIDLTQEEIIFAFREWREKRDRVVGFPARFHARYGDEMFYNSNHTCQYSMILTGAAFLHKSYLHDYTSRMPEAIRQHVDQVMNCEDIAMNFWVSHISRKSPVKVTSKWTFRPPTGSETLSQDGSHFQKRHECIRLFTEIYGYNPLKFTQSRSDSVLFKTRLPAGEQKCFPFV